MLLLSASRSIASYYALEVMLVAIPLINLAFGPMTRDLLTPGNASDTTTDPIHLICRAADDVVLIDFGLAGASAQVEDRAVDLYVLERALASTHRDADGLVAAVLAAYAAAAADAKQVLRRLDAVRARGRKRECFG